MKTIFAIIALTAISGFAQTSAKPSKPSPVANSQSGLTCSYYARRFNGHVTASGKRFDSNALTAAHKTYPIGTKLKVTNTENGKSVVVTVIDRGPFVAGRDMSVSYRAAQELGFIKQGTAKVQVEQVQ